MQLFFSICEFDIQYFNILFTFSFTYFTKTTSPEIINPAVSAGLSIKIIRKSKLISVCYPFPFPIAYPYIRLSTMVIFNYMYVKSATVQTALCLSLSLSISLSSFNSLSLTYPLYINIAKTSEGIAKNRLPPKSLRFPQLTHTHPTK